MNAEGRGSEQGAAGTPLITEHAAATFGARIQTSPHGARKLTADAVDLHHRLPKLNAGIAAGTVRVGHARHVAEATRELSADAATWVDAEVVEVSDGRSGWKRFEALVEAKVAAAFPELARAKEETAARDRYARVSRVNRHGIATLTIRDHAGVIMPADAALTFVGKALEDKHPDLSLAERRLAAARVAAEPQQPPRPAHRATREAAGANVWRDPHGTHSIVDNTGTRKVPAARPPTVVR